MTLADLGWAFLRIVILLGFLLGALPVVIWLERRVLAWFQNRIGPNRLGPFGLLQPMADAAKLFFKEEIIPAQADRLIWSLAPALSLFPALVAAATIPWGPNRLLTPVADVDIGILYFLAMSSLAAYGVLLAGWASNNKYSLLGGLRASAQVISYELGMGLSLATAILYTGSLRMTDMVEAQAEPLWGIVPFLHNWLVFTPWGLVGAALFLVCMLAETNRAPFDLPEAESELVAGYQTEYSSMKFAAFFMGEYIAILAISGIMATCFLGGYLAPINVSPIQALAESSGGFWSMLAAVTGALAPPFWFVAKVFGLFFVFLWVRATLLRLRYDQLMNLGWRFLIPAGLVNLALLTVYLVWGWVPALVGYALVAAFYLGWTGRRKPEARELTFVKEAQPYRPKEASHA
ncbi:MAG: NADH-quinone oxidoreductase subunit NuoH [Fimbriimonadales bacterium]|jgi:NADH-quinone oxidoreductase subunit H|nr:NADH-quinone oxidoreductase subunit NuoH [Fimbriimonadales bacterium]GBC91119.1 NADH-quinone oxidoreductase subunit H [bacterium HR14]GIV12265.1 MAG: NADH-quinone oxidoreductase subunit H [Fimbriimonadales bacterium]CUU00857.1 NADH dehydrogenase subunit H [Armatimonadetes bacterium GBS]CUU36885.1 NADH dehydrogenase subunit H [Armatimonadetes bacterium GXS]